MILITGGCGFVGRNLVKSLLEEGYAPESIKVIDKVIPDSSEQRGVQYFRGDVTNYKDIERVMRDVETVFHLAAIKEVPKSLDDPRLTFKINVLGTLNVLEACRKFDVNKLVYSSSASVYGFPKYTPIDEKHPTEPVNPYGASKLAGEKFCISYHYSYGLNTICLRYSNIYGHDSIASSVIQIFVEKAFKKEPLTIYGTGEQRKHFTNIKDVTQANVLAIKTKVKMGVYNIAGPSPYSINDIVKAIEILTEGKIYTRYLPPRPGDINSPELWISTKLAQVELNYKPMVTLIDGIKELIEEMRTN